MPKPLTIIGGYLGAGKTTLVNRLLQLPDAQSVAVVVNDFGDINIDSDLIAATGADTLELTNGCICCQVTDDVQKTMGTLAERNDITHVICEVSGIGDPAQLGSWRSYPGFSNGPVVVCIDALVTVKRLADEFIADIVAKQIAAADIILLTKTDKASSVQVRATHRAAASINPHAEIRHSGDNDSTWLETLVVIPSAHEVNRTSQDSSTASHLENHRTETVTLSADVDISGVKTVLERSPGELVRAKGFVRGSDRQWYEVQLAGERVSVSAVADKGVRQAQIVLIASGPGAADAIQSTADQLRSQPTTAQVKDI